MFLFYEKLLLDNEVTQDFPSKSILQLIYLELYRFNENPDLDEDSKIPNLGSYEEYLRVCLCEKVNFHILLILKEYDFDDIQKKIILECIHNIIENSRKNNKTTDNSKYAILSTSTLEKELKGKLEEEQCKVNENLSKFVSALENNEYIGFLFETSYNKFKELYAFKETTRSRHIDDKQLILDGCIIAYQLDIEYIKTLLQNLDLNYFYMKKLIGYKKLSAPKLAEKYNHNYELQIRDWEQNFKEPLLKLSIEKQNLVISISLLYLGIYRGIIEYINQYHFNQFDFPHNISEFPSSILEPIMAYWRHLMGTILDDQTFDGEDFIESSNLAFKLLKERIKEVKFIKKNITDIVNNREVLELMIEQLFTDYKFMYTCFNTNISHNDFLAYFMTINYETTLEDLISKWKTLNNLN